MSPRCGRPSHLHLNRALTNTHQRANMCIFSMLCGCERSAAWCTRCADSGAAPERFSDPRVQPQPSCGISGPLGGEGWQAGQKGCFGDRSNAGLTEVSNPGDYCQTAHSVSSHTHTHTHTGRKMVWLQLLFNCALPPARIGDIKHEEKSSGLLHKGGDL